jgi:Protein of unknown function (DUF993)
MTTINLPTVEGRLAPYAIQNKPLPTPTTNGRPPRFNRVAYSAAHVVADPLADNDPWLDAAIDWDRTIGFRHYLWDLGLGVAEAMDTAQRGMGLDWTAAQALIRRALDAAKGRESALIAFGAGTDHLAPGPDVTIDDVIRAYEEQIEFVENLGGRVILMASRALARVARGPEDYLRVYSRIVSQAKAPLIIHWLGEMFDPSLEGYWGRADHTQAMDVCFDIIADHAEKVDGIKISLLSKDKEIAMRRRLAKADATAAVRMYTGDDFNYVDLIVGDEEGYSHALLGIFDAIAPAASAGLVRLAANDVAGFRDVLTPTVPLARHIFKSPTRFYKTGVVFLAYLNGLQDHFVMISGQQSARSLVHMAELFRLADAARVLRDPDLAADRMRRFLALGGIS